MSNESQFWWNWGVNLATAIATFGAAFVALFGDWAKAKLFSPKLVLSLQNDTGEKTTVTLQWSTEQGLQQRTEEARYYRIRLENKVRWPSANQTAVYLLSIEEPGPDDVLQVTWSGELPVQWTHQAIHPVLRTIGPDIYCDLCSVVKGKWLQLHPLIVPNNFLLQRRNPTRLVVSLQAKGSEGESTISRFEIAWDGKWDDGDLEMRRHLIVKDVTQERNSI
ncbi:MAG TPA: hypothetical protein DDY39_15750 [Nitrospira sp.]|nr:hypothetical protein [Nitrospira sp.]HBR50671.1 hypothetical protein [Nitrospira sp.]